MIRFSETAKYFIISQPKVESYAVARHGFSYLSKVRARGLLNLGKKHLDHQNWENLMQSKRPGLHF